MARNRMIKPEFWSSEDIIELEIPDRLFYIGFWNFCDDNGILPDKPKSIKCNIFPADMIDCKPIIENLVSCGLLVRYMVGTESYLRVAKWDKHQTIKHPTFKYPLNDGTIPVHVRYKSGTCTEGVQQKEKEKEKEKEKLKEIKSKPKTKVFAPPTYEEFLTYCKSEGFSNIALRAFKGYQAGDWHDAKGTKIKSWKQKLQNGWFKSDNKDSQSKPQQTKQYMP